MTEHLPASCIFDKKTPQITARFIRDALYPGLFYGQKVASQFEHFTLNGLEISLKLFHIYNFLLNSRRVSKGSHVPFDPTEKDTIDVYKELKFICSCARQEAQNGAQS
jgi:hypothetical protein